MYDRAVQDSQNEHYRGLIRQHGRQPAGVQMSAEGQDFRFRRLLEVGDLGDQSVLDLGCGPGFFYDAIAQRFPTARYTGIDILPEMVAEARRARPGVSFLARDVLKDGFPDTYDTVLLSAIFNNARPDLQPFMEAMVAAAFAHCRRAVAFNFISSYVNQRHDDIGYSAPEAALAACLRLTRKVVMHHHYERCDVAVFLYR